MLAVLLCGVGFVNNFLKLVQTTYFINWSLPLCGKHRFRALSVVGIFPARY